MERSVTLEPVQNWYNVTFDVAFWMVMYLFVRGAFRDVHVSLFFSLAQTFLMFCYRLNKISSPTKASNYTSRRKSSIFHCEPTLYDN